ncbi:hypothetical protein PEC302107_14760 [Pectobacterium araliae]|nr:hypothetical protein PEC302107_14760 [Pectobacterium carotovorum subsp. carotovorum]
MLNQPSGWFFYMYCSDADNCPAKAALFFRLLFLIFVRLIGYCE